MRAFAHLQDEHMNCDLASVCGGVLSHISRELEVSFPVLQKMYGPAGSSLPVPGGKKYHFPRISSNFRNLLIFFF